MDEPALPPGFHTNTGLKLNSIGAFCGVTKSLPGRSAPQDPNFGSELAIENMKICMA